MNTMFTLIWFVTSNQQNKKTGGTWGGHSGSVPFRGGICDVELPHCTTGHGKLPRRAVVPAVVSDLPGPDASHLGIDKYPL